MFIPFVLFAVLAIPATADDAAIVRSEPAVAPGSDGESARVFHARVLDRETLQPVANVQVVRFDGKVAAQGDSQGVFAFPMDLRNFGSCQRTESGGFACSMDNEQTTRFFLRGRDISPVLVRARKYREWEKSSTFLVWRKATLRGVWLDAGDKPVGGRDLELTCDRLLPSSDGEEFPDLRATTNDKGEFLFESVAANVSFVLRTAGKEDALVELDVSALTLAPAETRELRLHALQTARVHGIVRDSEGHPADGAEVRLERGDRKIDVDTASDGSFSFERVGIGHVELKAVYPSDFDGTQQGLVLAFDLTQDGQDAAVDVQLHPVHDITGRVVDAQHRPVPKALVCYEPVATPCCGRSSFEHCDDQGAFVIPRVISDECRMLAGDSTNGPQGTIEVVPAGTHGVEFVLEASGKVSGRVQRPNPAQLEQYGVFATRTTEHDVDPLLYAGGGSILIQVPAGRDNFELGTVPEGTWRISASIDGRQVSGDRDVVVQVGQTTVCPDLVLQPMSQVVLISATSCGDLAVEFHSGKDAIVHTSLARGRIKIVEVPTGRTTIVAKDAGRTVCEKTLELLPGPPQLVGLGFER
jgi:hypothetical protein